MIYVRCVSTVLFGCREKKILNTCFVFGMFDLGVFLFWVKEVWKFLFKERTRFGIVIGVVDELGSELKLTVIFFFFGY